MAENDQTPGEQKPKIIVDDDWKAQARAEKEKLAREAEQKKQAATMAQAGAAAPGGTAGGVAQAQPAGAGTAAAQAGAPTREAAAAKAAAQERQLPPATLATHVNSLVSQVFMALGGMEDPRTKRRYMDLDLAKYHIDTLAMLEQKTKGNLTEDEKRLLDQGLYECRMQYVHIAQNVVDMTAPGAEFEQ